MRKVNYIAGAALALVLILMTLQTISGINSYAATTLYTSALEDLQSDSSFNFEAYPVNDNDNSLNVIQIAESTGGELFIYVHQPSARVRDLKASSINIAREPDNSVNLRFDNYKLNFINSSGVFFKYAVQGLKVETGSAIRYYNISNILRPFNSDIDEPPSDESQTISEVPNIVAQIWTAITTDGRTSYYKDFAEEVVITEKFVDFIRYTEGYWLWKEACDAHYVAFSTDYDIETLYDADVRFASRSCHHGHGNLADKDTYTYGESTESTITLKDVDTAHTVVSGLFGEKHSWSRIESVSEFKKKEKLTPEAEENLKNKQWVLRFTETDYSKYSRNTPGGSVGYDEYYTEVSDVIILRLHFKTKKQEYNLGVVDNKQAGDEIPGNPQDPFHTGKKALADIPWWVWVIIVGVVVVIALILICIFVPGAAPAIGRGLLLIGKGIIFGIYYLFYGLFWLISAPFRLIAKAIKNRKDKPKPSQSRKPAQKPKRKSKPKKAGKKK
jgi:hypothetical protein